MQIVSFDSCQFLNSVMYKTYCAHNWCCHGHIDIVWKRDKIYCFESCVLFEGTAYSQSNHVLFRTNVFSVLHTHFTMHTHTIHHPNTHLSTDFDVVHIGTELKIQNIFLKYVLFSLLHLDTMVITKNEIVYVL